MSKNNKYHCHTAIATTLKVIGGKWKPLILWHLFEGKIRFNELQRQLKGISQKMLATELRALEKDGIVHREIYPEVPPKVEYWVTPYGQSLKTVLNKLAEWGQKHVKNKKN
jgi:DNA-binding HxlR family transcriptional regulator